MAIAQSTENIPIDLIMEEHLWWNNCLGLVMSQGAPAVMSYGCNYWSPPSTVMPTKMSYLHESNLTRVQPAYILLWDNDHMRRENFWSDLKVHIFKEINNRSLLTSLKISRQKIWGRGRDKILWYRVSRDQIELGDWLERPIPLFLASVTYINYTQCSRRLCWELSPMSGVYNKGLLLFAPDSVKLVIV